MFAWRYISTQTVASHEQLKSEIARQLKDDVSGQFDVGFIQGASLISIRTSCDLSEVWGEVLKGSNVTLWCDGLKRPADSVPPLGFGGATLNFNDENPCPTAATCTFSLTLPTRYHLNYDMFKENFIFSIQNP